MDASCIDGCSSSLFIAVCFLSTLWYGRFWLRERFLAQSKLQCLQELNDILKLFLLFWGPCEPGGVMGDRHINSDFFIGCNKNRDEWFLKCCFHLAFPIGIVTLARVEWDPIQDGLWVFMDVLLSPSPKTTTFFQMIEMILQENRIEII